MTKTEERGAVWGLSVHRAIAEFMSHGGRAHDVSMGMMRGLEDVLNKLPAYVTARWPLELIVLQHLHSVDRLQRGDYLDIRLLAMAQQGLGVGQAMAFLKNLYWTRKDVPNVHAMQLWSRQQIIDDLGKAFGEPIADAIAEPSKQLVLNALIFKQYDVFIARPPASVVCEFRVPVETALNRAHRRDINFINPPYGIQEGYVASPGSPIVDLPLRDAEAYYERATGLSPPGFYFTLNPLEIDYADEAKEAEAALREIDRPFQFPIYR